MKEYLTVGKFAKLAGVTPKTLKHYEKLKLLEPDYIDPITGYRYYGIGQMKKVYEILSLKNLGLPLKEIKMISNTNELKRVISEKKKNLEKEINRLQSALEFINKKERELIEKIEFRKDFEVGIASYGERRYYKHLLNPPIEKLDSPQLYQESLKMEREFPNSRILFKGSILDKDYFMQGKYRCISFVQTIENLKEIEENKLLILPEGKYLCVRYRGSTVEKSDVIMREIVNFIGENSLTLSGEILGFAHRGAHTKDRLQNYESEIQLRLK